MFLYFLPGFARHQVTDALLDERLGGPLADCLQTPRARAESIIIADLTSNGPGDRMGCVVVALPVSGDAPDRIGYYPDQQEWRDCGAYWIGLDTQQRPTPDTLARRRMVDGYEYELGDGNVWTCPTIRYREGISNLPSTWGVDAAGDFRERLMPEYEAEWAMAGEMVEVMLGGRHLTKDEAWDYCVRSLAINYRVGPHEASRLGLLNTKNYVRVFRAAVDGDRLEEYLNQPDVQDRMAEFADDAGKKNGRDTLNPPPSNSGAAGDSPATAPQSPMQSSPATSTPAKTSLSHS